MVLGSGVHHWTYIDLNRIPRADLLFQLSLALKAQVTNVNIVLESKGNLSIAKDAFFS